MKVQAVLVALKVLARDCNEAAWVWAVLLNEHPGIFRPLLCGHFGGCPETLRTPTQGRCGCGARNRRSPTGGAAKGIEL